MVLRLGGHDVRVAFDGRSAHTLAEEFRPEVAILDIGLPHVNGHELARLLRAAAWARDLLLVALSGWGQEADRRRSREAAEEGTTTSASVPAIATPPPLPTTPIPAAASGTGSALGSYESGSFFGRTSVPAATPGPSLAPATGPAGTEVSVPATPASGAPAIPEPAPSTGDWRKDALARFKKMPDLAAPRGRSPATGR